MNEIDMNFSKASSFNAIMMHYFFLVERPPRLWYLAFGFRSSPVDCSMAEVHHDPSSRRTSFRRDKWFQQFRKWSAIDHTYSKKTFWFSRMHHPQLGLTHIIFRQISDHPRRHISAYTRKRVRHSENSSRKVRCNIETIAQISGGDSAIEC